MIPESLHRASIRSLTEPCLRFSNIRALFSTPVIHSAISPYSSATTPPEVRQEPDVAPSNSLILHFTHSGNAYRTKRSQESRYCPK